PIAFELTHTADLSEWTGDASDARWRAFVEDVQGMVERNRALEQPVPVAAPPRPAPAMRPAAPASRERLRPGNDDVIFAARRHGAAEPAPAVAIEPLEPVMLQPESDEFHCLCVVDDDGAHVSLVRHAALTTRRHS